MDGFSSVIWVQFGIIFLAAIVHASLQCELGALLLLYHSSLGKHIKKKTKQLVSNYIFGSALLICLMVATTAFLIATLTKNSLSTLCLAVLAGVLLMLALLIWFFYYKTRRSTELWLPKSVARYISSRAKLTESNVEAFSLGMLTAFAEMPFSFILILLAGNAVVQLPFEFQFLSILGYSFIAILPLFVLRFFIRRGNTVVDVQKWRVRNKNFLKMFSGTLFLTLAVFLIAFKILGAK